MHRPGRRAAPGGDLLRSLLLTNLPTTLTPRHCARPCSSIGALGAASSGSTVAQILLLTKGSSQQDADALLAAWQANDRANIPTIVIDVSGGNRLTAGLLQALPVRSLMGYSSWGTTDNAVGIALSMGLTRLCYLRHTAQSQDACTAAFCQSLTFALVKDIAYCKGCRSAVQDLTPAGLQALVCGDDVTKRLLSALPGQSRLHRPSGRSGLCCDPIAYSDKLLRPLRPALRDPLSSRTGLSPSTAKMTKPRQGL